NPEQAAKPRSSKTSDSATPTEPATKPDAAPKAGPISKVKEAVEAEGAKERKVGKAEREKNDEDEGVGFRIDDDKNVDIGIEILALKKRLDHFKHLSAADKEAQIVDGIFRYGPYAMFVLLPAFGFLLKVLYLGRGRRYPLRPRFYSEHLVFAAHNTAFLA